MSFSPKRKLRARNGQYKKFLMLRTSLSESGFPVVRKSEFYRTVKLYIRNPLFAAGAPREHLPVVIALEFFHALVTGKEDTPNPADD
jgi:hypothetical protein